MKPSTHNPTPTASTVSQDPRWSAVLARDPGADGQFVYAVKTTGVYCRPSSSSRLPRPENVLFFDSAAAAEAAGFRPSRRAAADRTVLAGQHTRLVADACRFIESAADAPSLRELAERADMSPYHFHRVFKAATGLTPKGYALAWRSRKLREQLARTASVTEAIYDAGFNSGSRFYESSERMLGMRPTAFRAGGEKAEIRFAVGECSLGSILVAHTGRGICAVLLGEDPDVLARQLQDQFPRATLIGGDAAFEQLVAKVVGFVEAPRLGFDLPLDVRGTAFQERVWQALRDIPVGATVTYAELARRVGAPKAIRAVGSACAANRVAVAIPCHRVVRSDGELAGYRWGVERKRELLGREKPEQSTQER